MALGSSMTIRRPEMAPQEELFRAVLLFGAPGSGKGTQGKIQASIPGFAHVSSGDMFRELEPESDLVPAANEEQMLQHAAA
jgi:adenylate kinase family enzyme